MCHHPEEKTQSSLKNCWSETLIISSENTSSWSEIICSEAALACLERLESANQQRLTHIMEEKKEKQPNINVIQVDTPPSNRNRTNCQGTDNSNANRIDHGIGAWNVNLNVNLNDTNPNRGGPSYRGGRGRGHDMYLFYCCYCCLCFVFHFSFFSFLIYFFLIFIKIFHQKWQRLSYQSFDWLDSNVSLARVMILMHWWNCTFGLHKWSRC